MASLQRFATLEVGRGVAATMVALSHATSLTAEPRWLGTIPFGGALANMNAGVDFFFVLSGFLITFVHWDDFGCPTRLAHYASRRFSRIFPAYWIILSVIVPIYLMEPNFGASRQHNWIYIVASYLLIPMPQQPVLGVAWTLTYEVFFYLLLGIAVVFGRATLALFAAWLGVIVFCQIFGIISYPASFFGNAYGAEFLLGMAVAALHRNGNVRLPGFQLLAGVVVFFATTFFALNVQLPAGGTLARLIFGSASALIILGAVTLEKKGRLSVPKWLLPLGAASYAIYLSHPVIESALVRIIVRGGLGWIDAIALCFVLLAGGVIGGFAYHFAIERPVTRIVRHRLPKGILTNNRASNSTVQF